MCSGADVVKDRSPEKEQHFALCLYWVSGIREQVSFILVSKHQAQREASAEECCKNELWMLNKE